MEERNVKIVRDPRKSLKSIKFNNSKNLSVTWCKENAWKWNFITLLLLITPESKLEHGGVGSFLKCSTCVCLVDTSETHVSILNDQIKKNVQAM